MVKKPDYQRFKPQEIARSFPDNAETLLLDTYLTDEAAASARVFRVYRETPPHYQAGCDEYLYVLSGTGTFWDGRAFEGRGIRPRRYHHEGRFAQKPRFCARKKKPARGICSCFF